MSADVALVDTNVLVEAVYDDAPHHDAVAALFSRARAGEISLAVLPQIVGELYAITTDARRVARPLTAEAATDFITRLLALPGVRLLPLPEDAVPRWLALLRDHPFTRGRAFDLFVVAAMQSHGISRIYTYNRPDFARIAGVEVLSP